MNAPQEGRIKDASISETEHVTTNILIKIEEGFRSLILTISCT